MQKKTTKRGVSAMKKELTDKLWKVSNTLTQYDDHGLKELNEKGVILGIVLVFTLAIGFGWLIGGL